MSLWMKVEDSTKHYPRQGTCNKAHEMIDDQAKEV
jgi:hypothetical protein